MIQLKSMSKLQILERKIDLINLQELRYLVHLTNCTCTDDIREYLEGAIKKVSVKHKLNNNN